MSAKFVFSTTNERDTRVAERFCAKVSEMHTISLTENAAERVVRLRKHGDDGQRLIPHEDGYNYALGLGYEGRGMVHIRTTSEETDVAEAIFHPLVDILVKILCEAENATEYLNFGDCEEMHYPDAYVEPFVAEPSPCSVETLQYLFSSEYQVKEISFGPVCIGEDLTRAFACPENPANKSGLSVRFTDSKIINNALMGQSLRNNSAIRKLTFWPKDGHNVVPLVQGLSAHPTLEVLVLKAAFGQSLTIDQSQAMCQAILGIKKKLFKLEVDQWDSSNGMHQYTFDGLWEMLSRHESINEIHYFYHRCRMWTENHIAKVCTAIRANPRIVQIDEDFLSDNNSHMLGHWNRDVKPLLEMNRLQIRINELMSHQRSDDSTRRAWLELLVAESNSFAGLYQILRGTVDVLADVLEGSSGIVVARNRKGARQSIE